MRLNPDDEWEDDEFSEEQEKIRKKKRWQSELPDDDDEWSGDWYND